MRSRDYDVVVVSDFRHRGGTTASIAQEVEVQARLGLRTALIQVDAPYLAPRPWAERIRNVVAAGLADVVGSKQPVTTRLLLLRHPRVFTGPSWSLAARGDHTLMIANQVPRDGAIEDAYYDVAEVRARLGAELGSEPEWSPIGPMVRDALTEVGAAAPAQTDFDWHNVIDVASWAPARRQRTTRGPHAIGRHSRDDVKKWPETLDDLLAAYPESGDPIVRILGGADAVHKRLGRPPAWNVYSFGAVRPEDFLAGLDLYVYFHHSGLREAFGRAVLEALASGLHVVTHPYLERLFGDTCVYSEASDAGDCIDALSRDLPEPLNQRGIDLVRERYDWEVHRRRLDRYLGRVPSIVRPPTPRRRVLFFSSNGGGMGHLTRLLAIARKLPSSHESMFVTLSSGVDAVRAEGFWVDHIPSADGSILSSPQWLAYLQQRLIVALQTLRPHVVVFDGTFAYAGLVQALADFPDVHKIWCRRGMWKPVSSERAARSAAQLDAFNIVLEPGDFAAAVDRGVTSQQRHRVRVLQPLVFLEPHELTSRQDARVELGLPPDATAALINLGAGNINRLDLVVDAILDLLERAPDLHLIAAQSLISRRGVAVDSRRVIPLQTYPLSRVLKAFDFCIAAPGYNSFHELLANRIPSLFIPNEQTALDDQLARARWAAENGCARLAREGDRESLHHALADLLDPAVRASLAERCAALPPCDGARQAAELIANLEGPSAPPRAEQAKDTPAATLSWSRRVHEISDRAMQRAHATLKPLKRRVYRLLRPARPKVPQPRTSVRPSVKSAFLTPSLRRLLIVVDQPAATADDLERLVEFAGSSPGGAIVLAVPQVMIPLKKRGLTAELLNEQVSELSGRLDVAAYERLKLETMMAAYHCRALIRWDQSDGGESAKLLRRLIG